jgi:hypothetical protein
MKTYSLYLSTLDTAAVLSSTNNRSTVSYNVNFDSLFQNKDGIANLRVAFISSVHTFTDASHNGSLRASFSSNYQTLGNFGVNICPLDLENKHGTTSTKMFGDSMFSNGITINIPKGNNVLTISLCNPSNTLMTPPAGFEYQLWLYFDCFDE